jgi:peptidoglycan/xylan/chitin deacetylase (PgdA/CDA1 family)
MFGAQMKRRFVLIVSLIYFALERAYDRLFGFFGRRRGASCVVLYYHDLTGAQRSYFAHQLDLITEYCTPIRADYSGPLLAGARYCAVTFDDGYDTLLENAVPELQMRNIPATIFVIPGRLGEFPGWPGYPGRFMAREQLLSLPADLISIGSHTLTHPRLTSVSCDQARQEIMQSRHVLEAMLGRSVLLFSFPQGEFTSVHVDFCRAAGYERVFTILPFLALVTPGEYVVGRVWADPSDSDLEFKLKLMGAYRWLPYAFRFKRWLASVVLSHRHRHSESSIQE